MVLLSQEQFHPKLVSIVLPAYNERDNLLELIPRISKNLAEYSIEILVVDDNSPDGTIDALKEKNLPFVRVVPRKTSRGFALSIRDGIESAKGDAIVVMDSDGNHQAEYLSILISNLQYLDCEIGSRFQYGAGMDSQFRQLSSWIFNIITRMLTGGMITDHLFGFLAIRRSRLEMILFDKVFWGYGDYCIRLLFYLQRLNTPILQIPTNNGERLHGVPNSRMIRVLLKYSYAVLILIWKERVLGYVHRNHAMSNLPQRTT